MLGPLASSWDPGGQEWGPPAAILRRQPTLVLLLLLVPSLHLDPVSPPALLLVTHASDHAVPVPSRPAVLGSSGLHQPTDFTSCCPHVGEPHPSPLLGHRVSGVTPYPRTPGLAHCRVSQWSCSELTGASPGSRFL